MTLIYMHERAPDCRNFVAFFNDGSGCSMYRRDGDQLFDPDGAFVGDGISQNEFMDMDYGSWLELPDDFEMWMDHASPPTIDKEDK